MERQRGTVKWFSREKGWGFIRLESGEDIFVHHSDIEGEGFVTLEDDQPVEFSVEDMEKGPRARNVREVGADAPAPRSAAARDASRGRAGGREPARARAPDEERGSGGRPSRERAESGGARSSDGRRPLAEQLRERLARHFPGLGG